jgi:S-adenosylmethionine decarboxylase
MNLGTEWLIDASGCDPAALADLDRLRAVFDRVIRDLDLNVLGEIAWHQFDHPGGVSGLALLSESHLTCHTYPEFQRRRSISTAVATAPHGPGKQRSKKCSAH